MKAKLVACCLCCALLLCGCAPFASQNVGELLRAPALGQGQDEIQKALSDYLGAEPQYKFPKEGNWMSPLRRADLNGDGRDEAVLLYTLNDTTPLGREKGNNVYVAIMDRRDGEWVVVQDVQGLSTDVASLEVAELLGNGTQQLIVGYTTTNLGAKTLGVYTYGQDTLTLMHQLDYSRYAVGNFTGRGMADLVVVSSEEQTIRLQYVPVEDGSFVTDMPEPVQLDLNFTSCAKITPGVGQNGERLIVVDGAIEGGTLISQFVYYSGERFFTVDNATLRGDTARTNSLLTSRDVDGDGVVEVPLRVGKLEILTPAADKKLEYVEWVDFTGEAPVVKQYGILDSDRSVFVRLPDDWRGAVSVVDGEGAGEWKLKNVRMQTDLLEMRYIEDEVLPAGAVRVPGSVSSYLVYPAGMAEEERTQITMTSMG